MLWKQVVSLLLMKTKFKNCLYVQELLNAILLPHALAIIKIPGHAKLDCLEAKRNRLADISAKNGALKGISNSQTSVMVQRDVSPVDYLEKLVRETQQLLWEKKKKIGNPTIVGLI